MVARYTLMELMVRSDSLRCKRQSSIISWFEQGMHYGGEMEKGFKNILDYH